SCSTVACPSGRRCITRNDVWLIATAGSNPAATAHDLDLYRVEKAPVGIRRGPSRMPAPRCRQGALARSALAEVLVEIPLEQGGESVEGLLGLLPVGAQRHLVAVADVQRQQHEDARGLHRAGIG